MEVENKKDHLTINVQDLKKDFVVGDQNVSVLKGITFSIAYGDFIMIFGPSGCGKSTLLHCMMGLEEPSNGTVHFFGGNLYKNSTEDDRALLRKRYIGMVYQQPNWIKALNVKENVAFPLTLLGMNKLDAFSRAVQILKDVEMDRWAEYTPSELSSGQQQRVALARALIHNPEIIVADEPTGNLDYESGQEMMHLLSDMNQKRKKTIIMVTHDLEYIKYAQKVVKMFDGNIVQIFDEKNKEELFSNLDFKKNEKAGNNKNEKAISKN